MHKLQKVLQHVYLDKKNTIAVLTWMELAKTNKIIALHNSALWNCYKVFSSDNF